MSSQGFGRHPDTVLTQLARLTPVVYDERLVDYKRMQPPRTAKGVELRFFGGLGVEETADVLRVSPITVMREWKSAKAWLYRELAGPTANGQ
jgi:DNA-directed RNA polymerase specialized sigma24 family protein